MVCKKKRGKRRLVVNAEEIQIRSDVMGGHAVETWELYLIGGISSAGTVGPCKLARLAGAWGASQWRKQAHAGMLRLELTTDTTVEVLAAQTGIVARYPSTSHTPCRYAPKLLGDSCVLEGQLEPPVKLNKQPNSLSNQPLHHCILDPFSKPCQPRSRLDERITRGEGR